MWFVILIWMHFGWFCLYDSQCLSLKSCKFTVTGKQKKFTIIKIFLLANDYNIKFLIFFFKFPHVFLVIFRWILSLGIKTSGK